MSQQELNDNELMRYARQILLPDWDLDAQLKLKYSRIIIVGVGGLGCPVSQVLARSGVGYIHLIDFDEVSRSNLQRQTLFTEQDIGKSKVAIAKQELSQQNELIDIHATDIKLDDENAAALFQKINADLVIDCTDNFNSRYLINKVCHQLDIPLLFNSAIGEIGQIALFTDESGCYECLFGKQDNNNSPIQNCATSGVLASTVCIIGAMSAQIALDYLGRGNNPIHGKLLLWQGKTMSMQKLTFNKQDKCDICHSLS